jgi:hypothetical protein
MRVDHDQFHLGRNDAVVILFRKIWERELRALAEKAVLDLEALREHRLRHIRR